MTFSDSQSHSTGASPIAGMPAKSSVTIHAASDEDKTEVLSFLSNRPIHTVFLRGLIHDNGIVSEKNRGTFYAYRNEQGEIVGVGLIGHATLIETSDDRVLAALARLQTECSSAHLILTEEANAKRFRSYCETLGAPVRSACRERLFVRYGPAAPDVSESDLRPATLGDLDYILPVNAKGSVEETGVNPMEVDPIGFRARCAERIARQRVWVVVKEGKLVFKAEALADTREAIYLEAIYTDPEERGKGKGTQYLSHLCHMLLARTDSICLFVSEENTRAQKFYKDLGFRLESYYHALFVHRVN